MVLKKVAALAALATFMTSSAAHSWVEQLMVIDGQGQFTGSPGYARNATARTTPGFSDPLMVHILPGQGQPAIEERDINSTDTQDITPTDPMCKKTQQQQMQTSGLPRLSAAPGSLVALRYQENGHVTLPKNQPGKPPNRGSVYIYGTTQPKPAENFLDIFGQWNADGTGGDKRGKLIATQPFDDGHCYQMNSGPISAQRQQQYPHASDKLMGADLWCQNDIKLPADAMSGKPYTLYWVWDWPTEPGVDPSLPKGKAEVYTTCMDIDVTAASKRDMIQARAPEPQASGGAMNNAAIPSYVSSLTASASAAPAAASAPAPSTPPAPPSSQMASSPPPAASAPPAAPASSAPAAPPPSAPTTEAAMYAAVAASIVEAAIESEIASIVAADTGAVKITAHLPVSTVTVTAGAPSSAVQSAAAQSPSMASSPAMQAPASTPQASAPSSPPTSMNILPPVLSDISGTATAITVVPSASPSSSAVAGASTPLQSMSVISTTAAAALPSIATASAAGACGNSNCRAIKRSRILGHV